MLERTGADPASPLRTNILLRTRARTHRLISSVPLLAVSLALAAAGSAQQSKPSKKHAKPVAAPAAPAAAAVPFRAGEILDYRILFSKYAVNAAKVQTTVVEQRNFFGHPAWHF